LLIIHEDEQLLVLNKPAGINTHAPSPYAGEGIYDWLRHREPRWANLAIIHRLDKDTSGVLVFGKSALANRSLTQQFTEHSIRKSYILGTDRQVPNKAFTARSALVRAGEKYVARPLRPGGEAAETQFKFLRIENGINFVEAKPITGRTHQIRVQAAEHGFPILGDELYGGTASTRLWLHAQEITLAYPATTQPMIFRAPMDFNADSRLALRDVLIDPAQTNAYRMVHGASDKWPGWYVDRLGPFLLSQSDRDLNAAQREFLSALLARTGAQGAYHKVLTRQIRQTSMDRASPKLMLGDTAPETFNTIENGVTFELSFAEGYSVGLFLDQRDNRRRFLVSHVAADFSMEPLHGQEVLNTFAYTCGFSVCAALGGAHVTSLDLSRKYLDWGKRNFVLNGLDPGAHNFIYGDAFDWLRRMAKKRRRFDTVILDPPTFSQSKTSGIFRAEKDYGSLVELALTVLKPGGLLLASSNATGWRTEDFLETIKSAIGKAKRRLSQMHYVPQPPDFPISRNEPAYLKTVWIRIE